MTNSKIAVLQTMMRDFARRARRDVLARLLLVFASAVLLSLPATALAQTGQGIISGIVLDPSGASVPQAAVSIKNTDTNVVINVTTNGTGYYEIRNLNPGSYEVSASASGFEQTVHPGIVLLADGHPSIDMALQVGTSNQTVVVNGVSPLIDTQTVSVGQVLTSEEMSALPNGQAPIWLAMLSPGVQSSLAQNYQLGGADPSWNGAGPSFGAYGRVGANEYSLDGAPNMANQRGQAINLSAEELGQTSVNITEFDASVGHTYGISVTQTTKAGTNDLHGGIRYRRYDLRYFGKQHFQRLNYQYALMRDNCSTDPGTAQCQLDQNQFGFPGTHSNYGDAAIGGPVFIPKVFDGRNRLFFFVGVESEAPKNANSKTIAVPSAQDRTGNFGDLATPAFPTGSAANIAATKALFQSAGCDTTVPYFYGQYQIYNPYSATMVNGHPSRRPFCNNVIPASMISTLPMVQIVNSKLPNPNLGTSPTGNNFIYEEGGYNTYSHITNRYDYAVNNADHIFFRWTRAHYTLTNSTFLENNFGSPVGYRWVDTGALGWSHILSPKTIVDVTVGGTKYTQGGSAYPSLQQYKPSDLGLPTYVDQYAGNYAQFPILSINGYQQIGSSFFAPIYFRTAAIRGNLTTVRGEHTWRAGFEWRQQNVAGGGPGASSNSAGPSGQYSFDNTYVQQNDSLNANGVNFPNPNSTGLGYAAFLLGVQSTSTVSTVPATSRSNPYYAFYAGDTWRVTRKLTLVPGVRYEFEYGPTEKHNRQIVGWDPNAQLTFASAVQTAYQGILPTLTAAQRAVLPPTLPLQGGPIYAGVNGASTRQWENNWRFLPRIGAAYSVNPTTVVRAGAGLYFDTLNVLSELSTIDTDGFTATTGSVSSTVFGTDFVPGTSPLSNPFLLSNGTRFVPAVGSSLGADYYAGSFATIGIYPHNRVPARSWRVQASMEHQFGRSLVVQVAYVGSRTTNITLDGNSNSTHTNASGFETATAVPGSFYIGGNQRNTASDSLLGTKITNPFYIANLSGLQTSDPVYYNVLSKSNYVTSKTITIANLVKSNPQLNTLRFYPSVGTSQFQEFQANLSKRISNGLVANVAYQKNLQYDRDFYENQFDTHPSLESTLITPPWRLTATWVYTLPFGPSQRFARSGFVSTLVGGFKLSGSFEANPGTLLTFSGNGSPNGTPNIFFVGDPNSIRIRNNSSYNTSGATPTIYGFNTQAVTATPTNTNGVTTCTYSGTGFVLDPSCQPTSYNLRNFPRHVEGVRSQGLANWNANLGRTFNPNERFKVEARADLLNVFNHQRVAMVGGGQMNPTNSQFGQITSDNGNGREIILQVLMTF